MLGQVIRDIFGQFRERRNASKATSTPADNDNPLAEYCSRNTGRVTSKWRHYPEIYHRHFAQFRGKAPVVVEIGVEMGGSLQMWHHYFGLGTRVVGIDLDPSALKFAEGATTIMIGDQADRKFLATVRERVPHVDILIDDGGHTMAQQITTFEELYPHIQPNGVYLCEDTHTSLWPHFGGGYLREGTYVEFSKTLVDRLLAWYSPDTALTVDQFTLTTHGMHFYDSVVVIEKRPMQRPRQFLTQGTAPGDASAQSVSIRP